MVHPDNGVFAPSSIPPRQGTPMELKGSQTERNLLMAVFAGESQARNRYTYFASQARNDGYIQIA